MEITAKSVRKFFRNKRNTGYLFFWLMSFLAGFIIALFLARAI